ncbi:DUF320 domain-containing protein [Streptomyces sp. SID5785]|uniref:chaplin n=1 Tax=Streptomyces sp. SID5785 TaxID=2690309 RepID=UPI0013616D9D|nr:chaplin family protein [Streptomyces sp. SID5785]MZD07646.1 DUF320 domain-containing protein [Streptomyces sp. SID5785]
MRQVMRKGLITVAAASGALAVTGGIAYADAGANGSASDSPGVASGNSVQVPVHVPVNLCGNTIDVVGVLNPASGNSCANTSDGGGSGSHAGGGSSSGGGSHASSHTSGSPGVGSGNNVQLPIDVPVNACGNSIDIIGLGNAAGGNDCANDEAAPPEQPPATPHHPGTPEKPVTPRTPDKPNEPVTQTVTPPKGQAQLAETGSSLPIGAVVPVGAGALLAGAVLYRRARAAA